ncbi:universal stress protein [Lacihabitans soyangensis]|uniref:Universal stress protein n=1 Tax=Lacihabitans soyangensis TaxID=869394 RepID=A0AAE3GYC4_9BACT|nr:universal stress protein [Lacihabitans soyangensis]MCP9761433.1 universal stress protein [Lacihabitans soyangensis]
MKTIVVATDFSQGSTNAVNHSIKLAKIINAKITLVHAYSPPILDPNVPIGLIEETYQNTVKALEERLILETERIRIEGLVVDYKLSFSDLSSILNDICTTENVLFIVVGKTGYSNIIDKIIGSTANHLIDNIEAPLLVIPENYENEILSNLAYATQLEFDEEEYIEKVVKLAKFSDQTLSIVHIEDSSELNINANELFLEPMIKKFGKENIKYIQKEGNNFKQGINKLISDEHISLLALTTHKRGILDGILNPSKTKRIINDTQIPILVYSFD